MLIIRTYIVFIFIPTQKITQKMRLGVQPIEFIYIFASAKGAERGRSITIGEKGIR